MREMKDSGVEWIGEISQTWNTQPLKSIVKKHFGGCWGEEVKGNENDVLCIRIADFSFGNQSIKETASTMRNYTDAQIEKGLLLNNDLIVEKSGGGEKTPVGRVVIYNKNSFPERAMFANFSECLRLKDGYCARYIAYHLKALYFSFDMHYYFTQTTGLQNLDMQEYLSTILCIPSLDEQNKIAVFLDRKCNDVDALISNVQTQIEKLKAYKQSLITEVVTKGLNPNVPMKDSGVEWIGEIPETWNTVRVKQLLCERKERSSEGKEEPLSMSQKVGLVPTKMLESIPNMASTFVGAKLAYVNDLVFNKLKAHLGVFSVSKYDGLVSPDYAVYYSTGVINLKYLEFLFKTPQCISEFRKRSTGIAAGLTRLYTDGLFAIECPLPPKDEQEKITTYLDEKLTQIDHLISVKQSKIEKLEQYKRSLIYEYVTGKRDVM